MRISSFLRSPPSRRSRRELGRERTHDSRLIVLSLDLGPLDTAHLLLEGDFDLWLKHAVLAGGDVDLVSEGVEVKDDVRAGRKLDGERELFRVEEGNERGQRERSSLRGAGEAHRAFLELDGEVLLLHVADKDAHDDILLRLVPAEFEEGRVSGGDEGEYG